MKKTLFLSMVLALVSLGTFAQQSNGGQMQRSGTLEDRAKRQTDRINTIAQLSSDQYAKVLDISKNFTGQKDALRSSGVSGDDLRAKFRALNDQEAAQIKTVLTPDQYAKVEAARKDRQGAPRGGQ